MQSHMVDIPGCYGKSNCNSTQLHPIIIVISRSSFIFRDKKAIVSMKTFFKPLALSVWIFTIISAILLSIMLKLAFHFESAKDQLDSAWSDAFFVTVATFCQQGNLQNVSKVYVRIERACCLNEMS